MGNQWELVGTLAVGLILGFGSGILVGIAVAMVL